MKRTILIGVTLTLGTAPALAGDCSIGGHEIGASVADLKMGGHYERGRPITVHVDHAKNYRCVSFSGTGFREYIAVRKGVLVAVIREFEPDQGASILAALDERYGKGRRASLSPVPGTTWTPVGTSSTSKASELWADPACGLVVEYVESTSSGSAAFGISSGETWRAVIWTKGTLPPLDDAAKSLK